MSDNWWVTENADGTQHVISEDPSPVEVLVDMGPDEEDLVDLVDRYPDAVKRGPLPRLMDLAQERWDWDAEAIVVRWSREDARDIRWAQAKAYRDEDRYFWTLPVTTVLPGETIMVQCDGKSREKVADLAQAATWATMRGEDLEITFTDGANVPFTVNAEQTIGIKAAVTLNDARCHAASQVIRAELDAALEAGASADAILSIDITAGYPEP